MPSKNIFERYNNFRNYNDLIANFDNLLDHCAEDLKEFYQKKISQYYDKIWEIVEEIVKELEKSVFFGNMMNQLFEIKEVLP